MLLPTSKECERLAWQYLTKRRFSTDAFGTYWAFMTMHTYINFPFRLDTLFP